MTPDQPQYESLASLRQKLTVDDANARIQAYEACFEAGVDAQLVLEEPDDVVDELQAAGVIPRTTPEGPPASEQRQEMLDLLREVRDSVGGGA